MAKIQQKSYLYIYADRHGSDRHYFREQFEPLFERSKSFKKPRINESVSVEEFWFLHAKERILVTEKLLLDFGSRLVRF